ncbi:MAG: hypothetical protein IIW01_10240, partial [Thermoguttaceae bacterium]|nr:hypothetical protein [Thermoguttaceae bacterium]
DRVIVYHGKHKKNITISANHVLKIPNDVSSAEASMAFISIFPLAAIRKTKLEIGESAMVMGLGMLGIFAVQELKTAGAYPIIAVDPIKDRRDLAMKMGADFGRAVAVVCLRPRLTLCAPEVQYIRFVPSRRFCAPGPAPPVRRRRKSGKSRRAAVLEKSHHYHRGRYDARIAQGRASAENDVR